MRITVIVRLPGDCLDDSVLKDAKDSTEEAAEGAGLSSQSNVSIGSIEVVLNSTYIVDNRSGAGSHGAQVGKKTVIQAKNSVLNYKGVLENVYIALRQSPDTNELASQLASLGELVDRHGDETSKAIFNAFALKVVEKPQSRSSLRNLWDSLGQRLPEIVKVAESTRRLAELVGLG